MISSCLSQSALYSSKADEGKQETGRPAQEEAGEGQASQATEEAEAHPYADFSREELSGMLLDRDGALATCQSQVSCPLLEAIEILMLIMGWYAPDGGNVVYNGQQKVP